MKRYEFFTRQKVYVDKPSEEDDEPVKMLSLFDIIAIGVACMINGVFIILGESIKYESGPSIILSFVITGVYMTLTGLCYCELASRMPLCNSAYSYIYITIGEFLAFCVGWNTILQYLIGASSDARAFSQYLDDIFDNKISIFIKNLFSINHLSSHYPDVLAFLIAALLTVVLIFMVKESSFINVVANIVNVLIIIFIITFGSTLTDFDNWKALPQDYFSKNRYLFNSRNYNNNSNLSVLLSMEDFANNNSTNNEPLNYGKGGFFPYGYYGVVNGLTKCFYVYIGYDSIIAAGKEAKNSKRDIPLGIILSNSIATSCFLGLSIVLTLMVPYFLIDEDSPFSYAFEYNNVDWAKYIVSCGIMISVLTSIYAEMFVIPRIVCDMASDGLIFAFLSKIVKKFRTPGNATLFTGAITAIFAMSIELDNLIDMFSMGTLLTQGIISICIVSLRYRHSKLDIVQLNHLRSNFLTLNKALKLILYKPHKRPNNKTSKLVNNLIFFAVLNMMSIGILARFLMPVFYTLSIVTIILLIIALFIISCFIWRQPQVKKAETFKIPLVPFLPFLLFTVSFYLMLTLSATIWLGLLVWTLIGMFIYFIYGVKHSKIRIQIEELERNISSTKPLRRNYHERIKSHISFNH